LSPDEKRIAFVRNDKKEKTSTLLLANIDGTDQRELTARPIEKAFFPGSLSWSPDDKLIALSAANSYNENDYSNQGYEVFTVSTEDGQISQLTTLEWSGMNRVEWLKDGRALAVTARKKDTADANAPPRRSLWLIDYPDGAARKISVDLNDYAGSVSLTTDAKSLLVVQGQSESNVWVAPIETLLTGATDHIWLARKNRRLVRNRLDSGWANCLRRIYRRKLDDLEDGCRRRTRRAIDADRFPGRDPIRYGRWSVHRFSIKPFGQDGDLENANRRL
jgi:Tol biopolymer transport system component